VIILKKKNDEWVDTKTQLRYTGLQNALDHVMPRYSSKSIFINKEKNIVVLANSEYDEIGEVYEGGH
tara:strand:- start:217 stop:417 length:201 start_codon:yes stop_codon:yes gene_type:complete